PQIFESRGPVRTCDCIRDRAHKLLACGHGLWNSQRLLWGTVYLNPNSFAPIDGIARHPAQVYELIVDLIIGFVLIRWRRKVPDGTVFWSAFFAFCLLCARQCQAGIVWVKKTARSRHSFF